MRRIALKGTVFDREIAEITYGSTIVLCTVLGKYCRDYFYMRLIFRSYENAAAPRRFVSAVRAPRYAQLTIVIDFIDKAVQNSRRIGNRFVLNIHLIIDNRLCSRDTGTAMTSMAATANEPNTFSIWHFFSTARYLLIKLPTAPFDIVI